MEKEQTRPEQGRSRNVPAEKSDPGAPRSYTGWAGSLAEPAWMQTMQKTQARWNANSGIGDDQVPAA